jgi:peroxiredoxin
MFLGIACVALIAIDGGLLLRVRHLERRVAQLTALTDRSGRPKLTEGDRFPTVTLLDPDGRPVHLTGPLEQEPTLMLVSSQACDYCRVVKPMWNQVARIAESKHMRVLGLVLDSTPKSLADEDAPYPLLAPGDDAWSLIDQIPGIPAAILIQPDGTVARAFYGADQVGLEDAVKTFTPSP